MSAPVPNNTVPNNTAMLNPTSLLKMMELLKSVKLQTPDGVLWVVDLSPLSMSTMMASMSMNIPLRKSDTNQTGGFDDMHTLDSIFVDQSKAFNSMVGGDTSSSFLNNVSDSTKSTDTLSSMTW